MGIELLAGSFTPVVTPFRGEDVDLETFARLVRMQVEGGSHGVVVTGTSGEPSVLSYEERASLYRAAVAEAAGRIPVVAATGCQSLGDTVALTRAAQTAGAAAALVVTPYYIKPPQEGLVAYFRAVAEAVDIPIMIYHIPGRAGVSMSIRAVVELVAAAPNVIGMKHASADLSYVTELMLEVGPEFRVFAGLEEYGFPLLTLGGSGLMNAVGNIAPRPVADLYESVVNGDLPGARAIHEQLFELNRAIFWETNPVPIKYLMRRLGLLPTNDHRLPMVPATPAIAGRLDALLEATPWLTEQLTTSGAA